MRECTTVDGRLFLPRRQCAVLFKSDTVSTSPLISPAAPDFLEPKACRNGDFYLRGRKFKGIRALDRQYFFEPNRFRPLPFHPNRADFMSRHAERVTDLVNFTFILLITCGIAALSRRPLQRFQNFFF